MIHLFLVRLNSTVWTSYRCIKRIVLGRLASTAACMYSHRHGITTHHRRAVKIAVLVRPSADGNYCITLHGNVTTYTWQTATARCTSQSVARHSVDRQTACDCVVCIVTQSIDRSINQSVWWCDVMWLLPIPTGQGKSTPRHSYDIN